MGPRQQQGGGPVLALLAWGLLGWMTALYFFIEQRPNGYPDDADVAACERCKPCDDGSAAPNALPAAPHNDASPSGASPASEMSANPTPDPEEDKFYDLTMHEEWSAAALEFTRFEVEGDVYPTSWAIKMRGLVSPRSSERELHASKMQVLVEGADGSMVDLQSVDLVPEYGPHVRRGEGYPFDHLVFVNRPLSEVATPVSVTLRPTEVTSNPTSSDAVDMPMALSWPAEAAADVSLTERRREVRTYSDKVWVKSEVSVKLGWESTAVSKLGLELVALDREGSVMKALSTFVVIGEPDMRPGETRPATILGYLPQEPHRFSYRVKEFEPVR